MKKSMLNVITLALVLINLVLTVLLTFSLVSTNDKTNKLISKVAEMIDLDLGTAGDGVTANPNVSIDDIEYIDITSATDSDKGITVTYMENGKARYAVFRVSLGINKKSKDYETKVASINNSMKIIVGAVTDEAGKYSLSDVNSPANKQKMQENLLKSLQDKFQTDCIYSVTISEILVQ